MLGKFRFTISADAGEFDRGIKQAKSGLDELDKKAGSVSRSVSESMAGAFSRAGDKMRSVGASMTMYVTTALVGVGVAFGKMANDIDKGMDTIRVGTGATGAQLEALGDSMRSVARDVPNNIGQVSTAIADLNTRLGLTGKPLEAMSTQMLNLARITKSEIGPIVAASTRLFGDWSIAADKQSGALDYMFKISQSTGIGIQRLLEVTVQYGAPLRALGFNLETAAAAMGKWEKEGVNMETVLSGLRYGLGQFAKQGRDPVVALKQVETAILGAKSAAEATKIAFEAFGQRAAVDLSRAIIEGRFSFQSLIESAQASSETINKAAEDAKSFGDRLDQLKNRLLLAAEPLGNALLRGFEKVIPYAEKLLDVVANLGEAFADLPGPLQMAIVGAGGLAAAAGPLLMGIGGISNGIAYLLPLMTKAGALMGVTGLAGAATALGVAVGVVAAAFAAWKLYDNYRDMKQHWAAMQEGTIKANEFAAELEKVGIHIDRNGLSADQWVEKIGRMKAQMDETKASFDKFNAGWKMTKDQVELARISFEEATGKISSETASMLRKQIENLRALETGAHGAAGGFDDLSGSVDTANEALEAFNASYWDSFKGAENIPRAPWDTRIIQLEYYLGKVKELSLAENAALKAREEISDPLMDPILMNLDPVFDLEAHVREAGREFENLRAQQDRTSESMTEFGQVVSTTLTNATQTIAEKVTSWMGPFRHFAKAALAALMEGLFNPLFKILTAVGNAIGTWLSKALGGLFGGPGNTQGLGSMIKASLGIGAPSLTASAIGGTTAAAQTSATLGAGLAGASPTVIGGGATATAAAGGGSAAFLATLGAIAPYAALAIPATVGIMELVKWAQGPNSYEAGAKEVKRDYGLSMKPKDIAAFFSSVGVSEPEAWNQRAPLLMSPQFQQYAIAKGQTSDFSKMGPEWEAAYEKAMIGKWGDYNELFLNEYANKQPGAIQMEDWYDRLTIPSQSGQSAQAQQQAVNVRGGDMNLTVNISGSGNELVNIVRTKVIPILQQEMRRGSTGLRESIAASVRATAGAY